MAEVSVTLAARYGGKQPGDTIRVDEGTARQLRSGGIALRKQPAAKRPPAKAAPKSAATAAKGKPAVTGKPSDASTGS